MPALPKTGDAFLDLVRRSSIADDDVLSNFLTRTGPVPPSADDTATLLVQGQILTPFQARLILLGRHRGFKLGPYLIQSQIGAGGMGKVYLADHTALKRQVALKVLPANQASDTKKLDRFYREARAAAALIHPNVVHTYDVMCDQAVHFLVLEFIDGDTLEKKIKKSGRLSVGEAVNYAVQASAGLQHAHEKGIAHRDIKPANLQVSSEGIVKILDLGLAEFFEGNRDEDDSNSGRVMGTADYISPEQLLNGTVDHRADIYSLGATLYHMLTGKPPFSGTTTAKMLAHQMATPTPVCEVCDDIPESLSGIVAKMLEKSADDRYQSAAEVVQALLPFVETTESSGDSTGRLPPIAAAAAAESTMSLDLQPAIEAARAAMRRKKRLKLALVGIAASVLVVAVVMNANSARTNTPTADKMQPEPSEEPSGTPANVPPAALTDSLVPVYRPDIGRGTGEAVIFTPDGKHLIISGTDKTIRVFNAANGRLIRKLEGHNGNVRTMALVPGKEPRLLSAGTDKQIIHWNYATGAQIRSYDEQNEYVTELAPLPDGKRFLAAARNGTIWMWEIETGRVIKRYDTAPNPIYAIAVSRDGTRAVAGTWDPKRLSPKGEDPSTFDQLHVWWFDVESGVEKGRVPVSTSVGHLSFSPDNKSVAFGNTDGIATWELDTQKLTTHSGTKNRQTSAVYSKDGRHIFSTGYDRTFYIWDVATGKPVIVEPGMNGQGYNIALAPDGIRVAVVGASSSAYVWQLPLNVVRQ